MARLLQEALHISWRADHELVAAVRRGDDGAFEELFSRYRSRISSYVNKVVGDADLAQDIAQEVFISALRRLRDTERPIVFKPWIYQIAKNACIDELRRTRRNHEIPLEHDRERGDGERDLVSGDATPDLAIENKQQLEDLRGAFGGISDLHRRILVLRELEGLSYVEIGERLGTSRAIVESTLFRARRRLAEEYEELTSGRRCEHTRALVDAWEGRTLRRLGVREHRQLVRHLGHCKPCRRYARVARAGSLPKPITAAGALPKPVVASVVLPEPVAGAVRIPAPVPIPLAGWRRAIAEEDALVRPGSDSLAVA
jgi:RNA polymerase sigma factor (sigma-70 family)